MAELCQVAIDANVLQIMSERKCKKVKIDYLPARPAVLIPREDDGGPPEPYTLKPITLIFTLEDAMFGGVTFAALTCGHRVIVRPFEWTNFDALAKLNLKLA